MRRRRQLLRLMLLLWRGSSGYTSSRRGGGGGGFGSCSRVSSSGGSVEVGVEAGFAKRIRKEGPRVGDEAGSVGEGVRAGAVGVGAVEQEGEAAIVGVYHVGVAVGWDGGFEPEDGVGIRGAGWEAPALGGEEGVGGGVQVVGARGVRVGGEGLGDKLLASL